ncbi:mitochondrial carrier domain-containing protein [Butyriboletus roseoflavus]|nr:mitochondrial carrier domain-containing protein [Butyriboletus roseoflavus]
MKELVAGKNAGNQWLATSLAGASATIASDALMNPFDVIKQRMQVHRSEFRSVFTAMRVVYRTEGLSAFYVSYPTTLTMTVPFTAVQFTVYEQIKKVLNPNGEYSPVTHMIAGGMAGGVAAGVTTPLDVAKTLLQTRGTSQDPEIRRLGRHVRRIQSRLETRWHERVWARNFPSHIDPHAQQCLMLALVRVLQLLYVIDGRSIELKRVSSLMSKNDI